MKKLEYDSKLIIEFVHTQYSVFVRSYYVKFGLCQLRLTKKITERKKMSRSMITVLCVSKYRITTQRSYIKIAHKLLVKVRLNAFS